MRPGRMRSYGASARRARRTVSGRTGPCAATREGAGSDDEGWRARQKGQRDGEDFLLRLGKESSNTNTEVGARRGAIDDLFIGTGRGGKFVLGEDSDIASGDLRYNELRTFGNIVDGYVRCAKHVLSLMDVRVTHSVLPELERRCLLSLRPTFADTGRPDVVVVSCRAGHPASTSRPSTSTPSRCTR